MIFQKESHGFSTDFTFQVGDIECGRITIQKDSKGVAWIWNVNIHPKVRGIGLSNVLISDALEYIRLMLPECSRVLLMVHFDNEIAQKTYRKAGFVFLNEIHHDLYKMECRI